MPAQRWTARRAWPALGVGMPFALAAWLGLGPGHVAVAIAAAAALALALRRAGREETPRFGRRPPTGRLLVGGLLRVLAWACAGTLAALLLAAAWAAAGGAAPPVATARAEAIYELDARIATQPLPVCRPRAATSRVLLDRGAHPRLAPEGDLVWFDAADTDGRRQIHRLDRTTGAVVCWTCSEDGNNEHPSPGDSRRAVAFETDRFATWREPLNREIQLMSGLGAAPSKPSIRLTIDPAADRAPVLGPEGGLLVWSRQDAGRQQLVGAAIRGGHGGILLGSPTPIVGGGLGALMPLAWSADARSLVFVRGNLLGTLTAVRLDPATGVETELADGAVAAAAGASADGGWLAFATSTPGGFLARLPAWLGFLLAPAATVLRVEAMGLSGSGLRVGEPTAPGAPTDLGELAAWGAPTGVTLDPAGTSLVLGQRRMTPNGVEERIVEIALDCDPSAAR
jgi:hypothetical protein